MTLIRGNFFQYNSHFPFVKKKGLLERIFKIQSIVFFCNQVNAISLLTVLLGSLVSRKLFLFLVFHQSQILMFSTSKQEKYFLFIFLTLVSILFNTKFVLSLMYILITWFMTYPKIAKYANQASGISYLKAEQYYLHILAVNLICNYCKTIPWGFT